VVYLQNGILLDLWKVINPSICDNVNESGGHFIKWNKPGTERQILHDTLVILHDKWKFKTSSVIMDWKVHLILFKYKFPNLTYWFYTI
jgi:hypothetical protein